MTQEQEPTWIESTDPDDWEGELAELGEAARDPATGRMDNVMRVHSLDAASLRAHMELYRVAMRSTPGLPKVDRELVALVTSKLNGCHY